MLCEAMHVEYANMEGFWRAGHTFNALEKLDCFINITINVTEALVD